MNAPQVGTTQSAPSAPFDWNVKYQNESSNDFANELVNSTASDQDYDTPTATAPQNNDADYDANYDNNRSDERDDAPAQNASENTTDQKEPAPENTVAAVPAQTAMQPQTAPTKNVVTDLLEKPTNASKALPQADLQNGQAAQANPLSSKVATGQTDTENTAALSSMPQQKNPKAATQTAAISAAPAQVAAAQPAAKNAPATTANKASPNKVNPTGIATEINAQQAAEKPLPSNASEGAKNAVPQADKKGPSQESFNAAQTAMEKLSQEETAKFSEKDNLTSKISELLTASKGKISLTAKASKSASGLQASLLSGSTAINVATNTQSAQPTAQTGAAGIAAAQVAHGMETPVILPSSTLTAAVAPTATIDPSLATATSTVGVMGVDSTTSSSNSQASMAGRATQQAGSPAEQISNQIINAAKDGVDKLKVQLNPAELGRVDIKLEITQDGRVMAAIAAENQDSLDLLKQDSKLLEQALKDAGFETGSDGLSFSLSQGEKDESFADGNNANGSQTSEPEEILPDPALAAGTLSNASNGGLNITV
jgi:flagellar hook-length control protein FliK